jgi:hypothetical protein
MRILFVLLVLLFFVPALAADPTRDMSREPDSGQTDSPAPHWGLRVVLIIIGLAIWHWTQRLIGKLPNVPAEEVEKASDLLTSHDGLLRLTAPANRFLNDNPPWANGLLIVSSLFIDLLGLFVLLESIIGPSFRPFLGLILLFGLRQICQSLTTLPPPRGIIWRYPGFPSLLVTYDVGNDLFFSGHTALAVYGALELAGLGSLWWTVLALVVVLFETTAVILLRAHYTMDVFAGLVTALLIALIAGQIGPSCDRALARVFAAHPAHSSHSSPGSL